MSTSVTTSARAAEGALDPQWLVLLKECNRIAPGTAGIPDILQDDVLCVETYHHFTVTIVRHQVPLLCTVASTDDRGAAIIAVAAENLGFHYDVEVSA